jgi:hypothetical protein
MQQIHVEAEAEIAARPATVYAILADYQHGHPNILPKAHFPYMQVEQGGQGAGTKLHVNVRALGVEHEYHLVVSEPEPGRVLAETDVNTGLVTTFTVTPIKNGEHARVRIATDWAAKGGLAGLIERLITPPIMRRIYRKELQQLAAYVQSKDTTASSVAR